MAGGQGGGSRQNRPLTGGMGAGVGQMGNAPYQGGFAPAAPGGQMMMAGTGTPYGQMPTQAAYQGQQAGYQGQQSPLSPAQQGGARAQGQGGQMPAWNNNPPNNGGWNNWRSGVPNNLGDAPPQLSQARLNAYDATQRQLNRHAAFYGNRSDATRQGMQFMRGKQQDLRQYRNWLNSGQTGTPPVDPATGQPVTPPAVDPATGQPAIDPATGQPFVGTASDVYGHVTGPDGTDGTTPDPITGQPRARHQALAQQIAALKGQMQDRRQSLLGSGVGARGGPGDPRYEQMQQQMRKLWGQRGRGRRNPATPDEEPVV